MKKWPAIDFVQAHHGEIGLFVVDIENVVIEDMHDHIATKHQTTDNLELLEIGGLSQPRQRERERERV